MTTTNIIDACPELYLKHSTLARTVNGVEIYHFKDYDKSPFLGGYKNKNSSVIYHHAAMQTAPKKWSPSTLTLTDGSVVEIEQNSRETQTVVNKNQPTQTTRENSTQMTVPGVTFIASSNDKLITPRPYTTADQFHEKRLNAVIVLQSYYRRWQATKLVSGIRKDKQTRLDYEREQFKKRELSKKARLQNELQRRLHPKTAADFEMLFTALEKWRVNEENKIKEHFEPESAQKKVAMYELLEKETELIAAINRHRSKAEAQSKQTKNIKLLQKAADPRRWKAYDGKITEMSTQFTPRARELLELYKTLSLNVSDKVNESSFEKGDKDFDQEELSVCEILPLTTSFFNFFLSKFINFVSLTRSERYDVLATLIQTVAEHKCKLTEEIIQLAKREQDLLGRQVHENRLDGLRQRILTLFFQYSKEPTFNPEAVRIAKVPVDMLNAGAEKYQLCTTSQQYLPSSNFSLGKFIQHIFR